MTPVNNYIDLADRLQRYNDSMERLHNPETIRLFEPVFIKKNAQPSDRKHLELLFYCFCERGLMGKLAEDVENALPQLMYEMEERRQVPVLATRFIDEMEKVRKAYFDSRLQFFVFEDAGGAVDRYEATGLIIDYAWHQRETKVQHARDKDAWWSLYKSASQIRSALDVLGLSETSTNGQLGWGEMTDDQKKGIIKGGMRLEAYKTLNADANKARFMLNYLEDLNVNWSQYGVLELVVKCAGETGGGMNMRAFYRPMKEDRKERDAYIKANFRSTKK